MTCADLVHDAVLIALIYLFVVLPLENRIDVLEALRGKP